MRHVFLLAAVGGCIAASAFAGLAHAQAFPEGGMEQAPDGSSTALNLVCNGVGHKMTSDSVNVSSQDSSGNYVNQTGTVDGEESFPSAVVIEITGSQGRIHVPDDMQPRISFNGNSDGWWELSDVSMSRDEIRGRFRFGALFQPHVVIDRISGHVTISGPRPFNGTCEPGNPENRRF